MLSMWCCCPPVKEQQRKQQSMVQVIQVGNDAACPAGKVVALPTLPSISTAAFAATSVDPSRKTRGVSKAPLAAASPCSARRPVLPARGGNEVATEEVPQNARRLPRLALPVLAVGAEASTDLHYDMPVVPSDEMLPLPLVKSFPAVPMAHSAADEAKKTGLQDQVPHFLVKAMKGCECTYIPDGSSERVSADYFIDRSLGLLSVIPKRASSCASHPQARGEKVSIPLDAIQDVYLIDDGESCFPSEVIAALRPYEREALFMIVYGSDPQAMSSCCMLDTSRENRNLFLESLRVLCFDCVRDEISRL
mmetsp:Transcript_103148/g.220625  ORF Transcript_103148/g.220625 Transcript_103148/m.220625 type:complete len:307 (+) Transcript_103148:69-989(+)